MAHSLNVSRARAAGRCINVLVLGHSYVRRLGEYLDREPDLFNLGFDRRQVNVRIVGVGGAVLMPGDAQRSFPCLLGRELSSNIDILFIHIGENDLIRRLGERDLSAAYISQINYTIAVCHPAVIICSQLIHFPLCLGYLTAVFTSANTRISAAVAELSESSGTTNVVFWRHQIGLMHPGVSLFLDDRIHLNEIGMRRYATSVRAAIGRALHSLLH